MSGCRRTNLDFKTAVQGTERAMQGRRTNRSEQLSP